MIVGYVTNVGLVLESKEKTIKDGDRRQILEASLEVYRGGRVPYEREVEERVRARE